MSCVPRSGTHVGTQNETAKTSLFLKYSLWWTETGRRRFQERFGLLESFQSPISRELGIFFPKPQILQWTMSFFEPSMAAGRHFYPGALKQASAIRHA